MIELHALLAQKSCRSATIPDQCEASRSADRCASRICICPTAAVRVSVNVFCDCTQPAVRYSAAQQKASRPLCFSTSLGIGVLTWSLLSSFNGIPPFRHGAQR